MPDNSSSSPNPSLSSFSAPIPAPAPVRIVLVRPQGAGNIGSVARVMRNFGLDDLALVRPRAHPLESDALAMACAARDVLESARVVSSLAEALAGVRWACGTTARIGERRCAAFTPRTAAAQAVIEIGFLGQDAQAAGNLGRDVQTTGNLGQNIQSTGSTSPYIMRGEPASCAAFVFGPEDTGLAAEDLDLCHAVLSIPCSPAARSRNLAQAVCGGAYELWRALAGEGAAERAEGRGRPERADRATPADSADLDAALRHFQSALESVGFFRQTAPEHPMRELRRFLARARPTRYEIAMLRGIARKILNAVSCSRQPGKKK